MKKMGLLGIIGTTALISIMGAGLVQDNYNNNRPGVVYMVKGKPVLERRFDTNEQFQEYLNSEQGKREAKFYSTPK
jgi:hypothetical protein